MPHFFLQNMYLSDAMFMKILVGGDPNKSRVHHDEPPLGIDTGGVFRSLGVRPQSVCDRGLGPTVNLDVPEIDCSIGTYELTVRPVLTNFLGRLHGGALAMSIEHTARMHDSSMCHQSVELSGCKGEEWMVGADTNPDTDGVQGAGPPTIVRMEITYKASMTSALQITCSHNATLDLSDQENTHKESDSAMFSSNPFRIAARRSSGEVFNRKVQGPSQSQNSENNGSRGNEISPESSATYTCYWSS